MSKLGVQRLLEVDVSLDVGRTPLGHGRAVRLHFPVVLQEHESHSSYPSRSGGTRRRRSPGSHICIPILDIAGLRIVSDDYAPSRRLKSRTKRSVWSSAWRSRRG